MGLRGLEQQGSAGQSREGDDGEGFDAHVESSIVGGAGGVEGGCGGWKDGACRGRETTACDEQVGEEDGAW